MKVKIKHEELVKKNFYELSIGQVFIYEDVAWMRIVSAADEVSDEANEINVVCLSDGGHDYFWNEEVIIPKVAELNIEY